MSCAWPTSSCTLAVRASFRCSVGAFRIHSRSGSTPISSELACISMNLISFCRYSSGSQSVASACPPSWTYARNSCVRASTRPPYLPIVRLGTIDVREARRADPDRRPAVRRAGLSGHVPRRLGRGARGPETVALPPHRLEGGPPLGGRLGGRERLPRRARRRPGGGSRRGAHSPRP